MPLDVGMGYGKQLRGLLVDKIRVAPGVTTMAGNTEVLNQVVSEMKMGTPYRGAQIRHGLARPTKVEPVTLGFGSRPVRLLKSVS